MKNGRLSELSHHVKILYMGSSRQSVNSPESDQLPSRKQSTRKEVVNSAAENGQPASNGVYFFLFFASKRKQTCKTSAKKGKAGKNNFLKQMLFTAPICWSEYTTVAR